MSLSHRYSFRATLLLALALLLSAPPDSRAADPAAAKPKIRAITAFIRLDRAHYKEQIQDTLNFLRQAKAAIEKSGYEVQTIRITTQPFPEYTRDLSEAETLAFLRDYDALAVKEGFDASIGPALMEDTDDPREAELLAKILASAKTLEGSIFIGGEDGIHWKSIRAAAGVMKYLEANTRTVRAISALVRRLSFRTARRFIQRLISQPKASDSPSVCSRQMLSLTPLPPRNLRTLPRSGYNLH
jgi:hypothetical protein